MRARDLARFTAFCRVAIGAGFATYPPLAMRAWIGDDARRASAVLLARVVGARDLIIAAGTLAHLDEPDALRSWLFAAAAADAADMLLTLADHDAVPAAGRWLIAAIAGTGAGLGVAAVALLED